MEMKTLNSIVTNNKTTYTNMSHKNARDRIRVYGMCLSDEQVIRAYLLLTKNSVTTKTPIIAAKYMLDNHYKCDIRFCVQHCYSRFVHRGTFTGDLIAVSDNKINSKVGISTEEYILLSGIVFQKKMKI